MSQPRQDAAEWPTEVTVSVVIPTYDRSQLVRRAIDSVLAQTFRDFELLVIDDGSTDDTVQAIRRYQDPRIRLIQLPENRGVSAARNRGLSEAAGEFVAFLDSDDEWTPEKLERQVQRFLSAPANVGLIYTGGYTLNEGRAPTRFTPVHRGDLFPVLLEENVIHATPSVMIRRSVVDRVGNFDEDIPAIEDYDYWVRISAHYRVDFLPDALVLHHDAGQLERKSLDAATNVAARNHFYAKHGAEMRRLGVAHRFLEKSARRQLLSFHWNPKGARPLLYEALRLRPTDLGLYGLLARSWLPHRVFRWLARLARRLRRGNQ